MGTTLHRVMAFAPEHFSRGGKFVILDTPAPPHELMYSEELKSYLACTFTGTDVAKAKYKNDLQQLFRIWSGGFYRRDGVVLVFGGGMGVSHDALRNIFIHSYISIVFAHGPKRPSLGKWTPLQLCLRWYMFALASNVLIYLVEGGTAKLTATASDDVADSSEDCLQDINFNALCGKGKKAATKSLQDSRWPVVLAILAILMEPLAALHGFYQKSAFVNLFAPYEGVVANSQLHQPTIFNRTFNPRLLQHDGRTACHIQATHLGIRTPRMS